MLKEAVFHQPYNNYAYLIDPETLFVQLRAKKGDLEKVSIFFDDRYASAWDDKQPRYLSKLKKYASDRRYDYFKTEIELSEKRFKYVFLLDDGEEQLYYSMYGLHPSVPHHLGHFQYTYGCEKDIYQTPDWVKNGVFYEIMVDRFNNADETINPNITKGKRLKSWDEEPNDENVSDNYYGGDLAGIIEKLDYLDDLGVTAVYTTPIFESPSTHKYDVTNYKKIDPMFGDLEVFKELMEEAHKRGIKVVLDFIFNHTSDQFFAFQDIIENGRDSKYIDWYYIKDFPVKSYFELNEEELDENGDPLIKPNYETFAEEQWNMPKLRVGNPEVRDYLLEIIEYWIKEVGIDGLRFDVSDEIDHYFWEQVRKFVKEYNSDIYLTGETFAEASPWLRGNELDGITNYRFTYAAVDFFRKNIDVNAFEDRLAKMRVKYKKKAKLSSLNPLDSHDLPRVATHLNEEKERLKLIMAFQMTYIGVPIIYYGNEVGMTGRGVESRRKPMVWNDEERDEELFNWYKQMIEIRKNNPALRTGDGR